MSEDNQFERVKPVRPGEKVLRRKRRPRMRLRVVPNIPGFVRFLSDIFTRTPLIPVLSILVILILLLALVLYLIEHGVNEHLDTYGEAVWWFITGMQTMGSPYLPLTAGGKAVGLSGVLVITATFWGTIIATVTAYFQLSRRRPTREIVATVQYNLERLEELSLEELETLKDAAIGLIDARIDQLKEASQQ